MNVKGLVGAFNQVSSTFKCYIYKNLYVCVCRERLEARVAVFTPPIICPSPSRVNSATLLSLLIDQHRIHLSVYTMWGTPEDCLISRCFQALGYIFFGSFQRRGIEEKLQQLKPLFQRTLTTDIQPLFSPFVLCGVWVSTRELGWFIPEKQYQLRVIQLWGQKTSIHARLRTTSLSLADVVLLTTLTPEEKIMKHRMDILISYFMGRPHILTDYR